MKSLKESLFDKDIVTKDLDFSSKWQLSELTCSLGDYYNWYGETGTERELESKSFKIGKLSHKPMADTDKSMWNSFVTTYPGDLTFWGNFLRLVKMIETSSWIPEYDPRNIDKNGIIPSDIEKELKQYVVATGGVDFKLYVYSDHKCCFQFKKIFGAKDKYIAFCAIFREK